MEAETKKLLQALAQRPQELIAIMRENGIQIKDTGDALYDKFVFTIYSDLADFASRAESILERAKP